MCKVKYQLLDNVTVTKHHSGLWHTTQVLCPSYWYQNLAPVTLLICHAFWYQICLEPETWRK